MNCRQDITSRCDKNISRESGKIFLLLHRYCQPKANEGDGNRNQISYDPSPCLDLPPAPLIIVFFHLVVGRFVDLEIPSALLQNRLRLTDYTEVFCLNSRPYSGTSSFYCITVSSLTIKRMKTYTNHFNWLTGLMMALTTDVCFITTWQSSINVLVNISPHFIPGNPSIQSQSPEVDELGVGTACWSYQGFAYAASWWSGRKLF